MRPKGGPAKRSAASDQTGPEGPQIPPQVTATHTQNHTHRMVGVGRDLCGSSSPTLLLKQGHLQQAAQDLVQAGLEHLQRRRLHNLPGQPVPGLRHPQREEILPHVQLELLVLQFVPVAPCPVTGHYWIIDRSCPVRQGMRAIPAAVRGTCLHVFADAIYPSVITNRSLKALCKR